jgi:hypothetical protein
LPYATRLRQEASPGLVPFRRSFSEGENKRRSSCALLFTHGNRPANKPAAPDAAASTASHPAFVTIAIRPSSGMRWRELIAVICPTAPADYFCGSDWTTQISLESLEQIEVYAQPRREARSQRNETALLTSSLREINL